jgi:hypothetical protein
MGFYWMGFIQGIRVDLDSNSSGLSPTQIRGFIDYDVGFAIRVPI